MNSCIRYFGGKGNGLGDRIIKYFPDDYENMNYLEPFGGSAAILFRKNPSPIEIYNDLEHNVYSLFKVLNDEDLFEKFKHKCDLTYYSRDILNEFVDSLKNDDLDIVDRAYKYFIINRTAYNGTGGFSVAYAIRRNMSKSVSDFLSAIDRLEEVHQRLSKVMIHNIDANDLILKYDKENWLFYLDSPYHQDTRTSVRYQIDMDNEEQLIYINNLLSIKNAKCLVSGYDHPDYDILVDNGWTKISFDVKTQNSNRVGKIKVETIWFNY